MRRVRPTLPLVRRATWLAAASSLAALFAGVSGGCSRDRDRQAALAAAETPVPAKSGECRPCHEEIHRKWAGSHHAQAHRPVEAQADADAVGSLQRVTLHGVDYTAEWKDGKPHFTEKRGNAPAEGYTADFVLGFTPLRQYMVPAGNGRYQAAELAFDPHRKEWFNVFGDEQRAPANGATGAAAA
jgi:hypothetical protein